MPLKYCDMTPEQKAAKKARVTAWAKANPEKAKQNLRNSYARHKDRRKADMLAYRTKNKDAVYEMNRLWRENNRERHRELAREAYYRKYGTPEGKAYYCAKSQARGRGMKQATPPWVDWDEMVLIYMARPKGYEVDHIIPLKAKGVCGLHVPWNLQYLPWRENRSKTNRCISI